MKVVKIVASNKETKEKVIFPLEALKTKEFLTVSEVATLLSCSRRSVYNFINNGNIDVVNLGQRLIRIKRSSLDEMFSKK
ncbi:helix-turn-helix domain-containing protein [Flavivirga jejuensis]|nr:helix-turn-helix domain-containing protein [Flavivirga jejuensis]